MDPGPVLVKGKTVEVNAAGAWVKFPVYEGSEFTAQLPPEIAGAIGADQPDTDVLIPGELVQILEIGHPQNGTGHPVAQVKIGDALYFVDPGVIEAAASDADTPTAE